MVWRGTTEERKRTDALSRKAAMRRRIEEGVPVGLLAYVDDVPVAWCSIAPRETYHRSLGGAPDEGEKVWSLACFYVSKRVRGQGVAKALLEAAIAHAKRRRATIVEAYPVDEDSPSYRFMGFVSTFEERGFVEVGRAGSRRHVMQLRLRRARARRATREAVTRNVQS
jgi:GNAT superfamily N-acetyltransferase